MPFVCEGQCIIDIAICLSVFLQLSSCREHKCFIAMVDDLFLKKEKKKNRKERNETQVKEVISWNCENVKQMPEHDFKWGCECG